MKTTKTLLTIALVALTSTLFGRMGDPETDCNCCPTVIFIDQDLGIEEWMTQPFDASVEYEMIVESWMVKPFDSDFESQLAMEDWMSMPFDSGFEAELTVESWMLTPFNANEKIELEWWMATTWL